MLSRGALERSNNPYTESIVESCVLKNQNEIFAMWAWLGRKCWKRAEAMEKFVYLILWEKKNNSLEITAIIFKVFKKCKSFIQKEF